MSRHRGGDAPLIEFRDDEDDERGPLIDTTTSFAVAVVLALAITGPGLLAAARGEQDVVQAAIRLLVVFAFVQIALRLVSGLADAYRAEVADDEDETAAEERAADQGDGLPRRRRADDGSGAAGAPGTHP